MLFNFMLALTDLKRQDLINDENYQFLISGISGKPLQNNLINPNPSLITDKQWIAILELNNMPSYANLA